MFSNLKYFVLLGVLLAQTACTTLVGQLTGELNGVVIDKSTGKPIEGAIVVAQWQGAAVHLVDSRTVCFHVESATTDQDGRYNIAAVPAAPVGVMGESALVAGVYKEGYREVTYKDTQEPGFVRAPIGVVHLIPFHGVTKERLEYLARLTSKTSCIDAGASQKNLFAMAKAVFEESKRIASTEQDKKWVARFRRSAADAAIAEKMKPDMSGLEWDRLIDDYLRNNLK